MPNPGLARAFEVIHNVLIKNGRARESRESGARSAGKVAFELAFFALPVRRGRAAGSVNPHVALSNALAVSLRPVLADRPPAAIATEQPPNWKRNLAIMPSRPNGHGVHFYRPSWKRLPGKAHHTTRCACA